MKVQVSPRAANDIRKIREYISKDLLNPDAADKMAQNLIDRMSQLAMFPESGVKLDTIIPIKSQFRYLIEGKYLIIYYIRKDTVLVARVVYSKRDLSNFEFEIY